MEIDDVFRQARDHYLKKFREQREALAQSGRVVVPEVKATLGDGSQLYLGRYCFDLIEKVRQVSGEDKLDGMDVAPDARLQFPVFGFAMRGVYVRISHVHWDRIGLEWDTGELPDGDFDDWFRRWFDLDDERYAEGAEFGEIIHSAIRKPTSLSMDLGSAPTKALWEIMWMIEKTGATLLHLHDSTAEPRDPAPPMGPS